MSVEGKKGTTQGKIPKWEGELWSYLTKGDGNCCPLYDHCRIRKKGGWCPNEYKERLSQLLDDEQFNLSNYDFIKGGTCGRMFEIVEMLAQKCLKGRGVSCPPVPTKLFSLADEQHTIEARLLPLKAYHGAIWHLMEGWIIQLKDDDISTTKRLTLFHEAFHILAHCRTIPVFRKKGSTRGSFNELLADWFALCILMPKEWVKEKWAEVEDWDRMAEIFDVPKSAMAIRLRQLGLI